MYRMLFKVNQHENMCGEQNDTLDKIEHAAISADFILVFSRLQLSFFSLLAQQHPVVKQPSCMPGFETLEHLNFGNMDHC